MLSETEVVEILDELARVNNDLMATQRTLQLRTAELDRAVKQMNQLLGMANHDLRNPLSAIRGFSQTVRTMAEERLTPQEAHLLERIEASSDRSLQLVNEMVELSTIEHGIQLHLEQVDLRHIVEEAVQLVSAKAADKQLTLTLDGDEAATTLADPAQLDKVVDNLLTNAIKYTHRGGHVSIRLQDGDGHIQLQVTDDGVGIPADEQELIFQPFSRASSKPTDGEPSTGLGLAIANQVIAAHRGHLQVESTPGQGSTFTVTLPHQQHGGADSET